MRPADPGHAYGHGKAEHLAALAEAAILVVLSLAIAWQALWRLFGLASGQVDPRWYAIVVVVVASNRSGRDTRRRLVPCGRAVRKRRAPGERAPLRKRLFCTSTGSVRVVVCSFGHCRNSSRVMMWQVACIEAFDLLDARSGILGEIEDVLQSAEPDPSQLRFFSSASNCLAMVRAAVALFSYCGRKM